MDNQVFTNKLNELIIIEKEKTEAIKDLTLLIASSNVGNLKKIPKGNLNSGNDKQEQNLQNLYKRLNKY